MKRLFGTDGIRGVAGEYPLDPATVERIGRALSVSLAGESGHPARIVLGRDTRGSGPDIEEALVRGIHAVGGRTARGGVLTTPAVACVTRLLGYDAGVVVSASHNPYRDNGIKVFSGDGTKLPDTLELKIEEQILESVPGGTTPVGSREPEKKTGASHTRGATIRGGVARDEPDIPPEELRSRYLDWLRSSVGAEASFAGWRVVLDCAHGAASKLAPEIFRRVGAEVTPLNIEPDGRNINEGCGALHPEGLSAEVTRRGADIGFAFDGDADRCLVVDSTGRLLDGDYMICLAARDLKDAGRLKGMAVVGTVMCNLWLERALSDDGIRLLRASVGDKYVLEEMQKGGLVLGGEPSGHIIFLEKATTGDGLLTALLFLDLLRRTGVDLAAWAATVSPCPQILVNVPVRDRPTLETHPIIGPSIQEEERRFGGQGRLLVRYSGTEPKARIMVEGEPREAVEACAARLKKVIEDQLGLRSSTTRCEE